MFDNRKSVPAHIKNSIVWLIILGCGICVARYHVTLHQQAERIDILEAQVAQLLADTTRLRIPAPATSQRRYAYRNYGPRYSYPRRNNYQQAYRQPQEQLPQADSLASSGIAAMTSDSVTADTVATLASTSVAVAPQEGERPRKFTEPHQFDLNTIDSLTLIRIPGIAERTASVILKYRTRYGGFYDPRQLQEFLTWDAAKDYMDEWCSVWFTADASRLRLINTNRLTIAELQRHPYITHEQAVELVRYRTRHKRIVSVVELEQFSSFTPEELKRVVPYLSFEL